MATIKNEVFIGLFHEKFYIVGRQLTFGEKLFRVSTIYIYIYI